jgi:hypothetical protein
MSGSARLEPLAVRLSGASDRPTAGGADRAGEADTAERLAAAVRAPLDVATVLVQLTERHAAIRDRSGESLCLGFPRLQRAAPCCNRSRAVATIFHRKQASSGRAYTRLWS